MKKIIIATMAAFSLLACRQEPAPEPIPISCRMTTATFDLSGIPQYTVVYDTQGRMAQMTNAVSTVYYTYNSDGYLTQKEYFQNNLPYFKEEYTISGGLVSQMLYYEYYGGTYNYNGKHVNTYSSGKLQQSQYIDQNGVAGEKGVYTWTGENITQLKTYLSDNTLDCTINYTYDLNKVNNFNNYFPFFEYQNVFEDDYLDVRFMSKNMLSQTTHCNGTVENFTYTYTAQNLMDKVTGSNGTDIYRFTFTCP